MTLLLVPSFSVLASLQTPGQAGKEARAQESHLPGKSTPQGRGSGLLSSSLEVPATLNPLAAS